MIEMTPFRICSILIFVHYEIRYNMIVIAFSFLLETQCLLQNKVSASKQSVPYMCYEYIDPCTTYGLIWSTVIDKYLFSKV